MTPATGVWIDHGKPAPDCAGQKQASTVEIQEAGARTRLRDGAGNLPNRLC